MRRAFDVRRLLYDGRNPKKGCLLPAKNFDSLQSGKHQVRGAIIVGDTGSDQANRRARVDRIGICFRVNAGPGVADAEHPLSFQSVGQHIPVALLKNEQRHVAMREQSSAPQNHNGDGVWYFSWIFFLHLYMHTKWIRPRLLVFYRKTDFYGIFSIASSSICD